MTIKSSVAGLVVYQQMRRSGQVGDPQEGLEVVPGTTLLVVVNPKTLRVRARVNQADMKKLRAGIFATVQLDAYPDRTYGARLVQVDSIATQVSSQTESPSSPPSFRSSGPTPR